MVFVFAVRFNPGYRAPAPHPSPGCFTRISITTPVVRRLRLEKLLHIELSRSSSKHFKPLLDPGGRFAFETAARRFQN